MLSRTSNITIGTIILTNCSTFEGTTTEKMGRWNISYKETIAPTIFERSPEMTTLITTEVSRVPYINSFVISAAAETESISKDYGTCFLITEYKVV